MGYYVRGHPLLGDKAHPFIGRDTEGMDLSITFPRARHVRQFLDEFLTPEQTQGIMLHLSLHSTGDISDKTLPFSADVYLQMDGYRACVKANTRIAKEQLIEVARKKYDIDIENPDIVTPEEICGKVA